MNKTACHTKYTTRANFVRLQGRLQNALQKAFYQQLRLQHTRKLLSTQAHDDWYKGNPLNLEWQQTRVL
jgi:hypothetical protein